MIICAEARPAHGEETSPSFLAQYQLLAEKYPGRYVVNTGVEQAEINSAFPPVIATTNVKHLSRFTEAKEWQDINF